MALDPTFSGIASETREKRIEYDLARCFSSTLFPTIGCSGSLRNTSLLTKAVLNTWNSGMSVPMDILSWECSSLKLRLHQNKLLSVWYIRIRWHHYTKNRLDQTLYFSIVPYHVEDSIKFVWSFMILRIDGIYKSIQMRRLDIRSISSSSAEKETLSNWRTLTKKGVTIIIFNNLLPHNTKHCDRIQI